MGTRTSVCFGSKKNEELFLAAVEFLAHKYGIEKYTLVTETAYHVSGESMEKIELIKQLMGK